MCLFNETIKFENNWGQFSQEGFACWIFTGYKIIPGVDFFVIIESVNLIYVAKMIAKSNQINKLSLY